MKIKLLILLACAIVFLPLSAPVSAKDQGTDESRGQVEGNVGVNHDNRGNDPDKRLKIFGEGREATEDGHIRDEFKASASAIRQHFQEELKIVKDQRKKLILEKLGDKMNQVNTNRVNHWQQVLTRLKDVLNRIKATNKHNTELDAAIVTADAKIAAAQAAVNAQSTKTYTIEIASGSALKSSAGGAISAEQHDLQGVLKLINDAKQSVFKALMLLKRSFGGPLPKTASGSGSIATSSGTPVGSSSAITP